MAGERRLATRVSARLTPGDGRRFGLTVGAAFLVLAGLAAWRGRSLGAVTFTAFGSALVAMALLAPGRLGPARRLWIGIGSGVSRITTPLVMGLVYFGVLTPTGVLRRLVSRSPLVRPRADRTFWVVRGAGARQSADMKHQF